MSGHGRVVAVLRGGPKDGMTLYTSSPTTLRLLVGSDDLLPPFDAIPRFGPAWTTVEYAPYGPWSNQPDVWVYDYVEPHGEGGRR